MNKPYHRSTWPLTLPPAPLELLGYLDRDYGTTPHSTEAEVMIALREAGHDPESVYGLNVRWRHITRAYEARTGNPF